MPTTELDQLKEALRAAPDQAPAPAQDLLSALPPPDHGGVVGTDLDRLEREVTTDTLPGAAAFGNTAKRLSAGLAYAPPGTTFNQFADAIREAGFPDVSAALDTPFRNTILEDAALRTHRFLAARGYEHLTGPGIDTAKRVVGAGILAASLVKNLPLYGRERLNLQRSALQTALFQRSEQARQELLGGLRTPEAEQATGEMNALIAQAQQWRDDEIDSVFKGALFLSRRPPRNTQEASTIQGEQGDVPGRRGLLEAEIALTDVRGHRKVVDHTGRMALLHRVLGPEWHGIVGAAYEGLKDQYVFGRLGLAPNGAPGTTPDGVTFIPLVPRGALEILETAKLATAGANPDVTLPPPVEQTLAMIEAVHGKHEADAQRTDILTAITLGLGEQTSRAVLAANPPEPDLTPAARESMSAVGKAAAGAAGAMGHLLWTMPIQFGKDLEEAVSKHPEVQEWARAGTYMLTKNDALAEATRRPSQALGFWFRGMMERQDLQGLANVFHPALAHDMQLPQPRLGLDPSRGLAQDLTPEQQAALLSEVAQPLKVFEQDVAGLTRVQNESLTRANRLFSEGKVLSGEFWRELALGTAAAAGRGVMEPFYTFVDDPASLPGMLAGAYTGGKATAGVLGAARSGFSATMKGVRLEYALKQLATFYPEQAVRLRVAANRAIAAHDQSAIDSAVVAAQMAAQDVRAGIPIRDPSGFARNMRRIWTDLEHTTTWRSLEEMTGGVLPLGAAQNLQAAFSKLTGWSKRLPNKNLQLALDQGNLTDLSRALKDVVQGGGDFSVVQQRLQQFQQTNGRPPTRTELFTAVMPEAQTTLEGLIMAAERHNFRDPRLQALLSRWIGGKNLERLPEFIETGQQILSRIGDVANDTTAARLEFGLVRPRNELLYEVGLRKITNRISTNQFSEMGIRRLLQSQTLPPARRAEIETAFQAVTEELRTDRLKQQRLIQARDRLRKHDSREAWNTPQEIDLWSEITDHDIELLLEEYGDLFGGLTRSAIFDYDQAPPRAEALAAARARVDRATEAVGREFHNTQNVRARPLAHDERLRTWASESKELVRRQEALRANNEPADPEVTYELGRRTDWLAERTRQLKDGSIEPDQLVMAERAFERARHEHQLSLEALRRVRDLNVVRTLNPEGRALFMRMFRHEGLRHHEAFRHVREQSEVLSAQLALGNRSTGWFLPPHLQGQSMVDFLRDSLAQKAAELNIVEDLASVARRMPPRDYAVLGQAMREGILPTDLAKRYPAVARFYLNKLATSNRQRAFGDFYKSVYGRRPPTDPDLGQLDEFYNTSAAAYTRALEHARAVGSIPEELFKFADNRFYDPVVRGMHERPRTIRDPRGREAIESAGERAGVNSQVLRDEREALQFKRDTHEWRVRIDEPEATVNRFFPSEQEARRWLHDHYGSAASDSLTPSGPFHRGRTPYGDTITLAEPIGKKGDAFNPRVFGQTPIARLNRLKQLIRDTYNHSLLNAINQFGGRVLTDDEHRGLILRYSKGNEMAAQFQHIPNNQAAFGHLAGKWVHKGVLTELYRASRGFHEFDEFLIGLRESFMAYGTGIPAELAEKGHTRAVRFFEDSAEIVRANRITRSARAFLNNLVFNKISDYLAGTRIFSVENAPNLWRAFRLLTDPIARANDPGFQAAARHNLATGMFPGRDPELNLAMAKALGMDQTTLPRLRRLHAERAGLLQRMHEARLRGEATPDLVALEREYAALNSAVEEAELGMHRRFTREMVGAMLRRTGQDAFGREAVIGKWSRRAYNMVDEHAKLSGFLNLLDRGVPELVAAKTIKTFFQNYPEVPYYLRALPTWMRSLVVSFPYEALRIGMNAVRLVPDRAVGLFSIIPALNTLNMARAGIDWDRMAALLDARGHRDGVNAALAFTKTLYLTDPASGSIHSEIDFGNMFPFADVLGGRGILSQLYDELVPPSQRSWLQSLGGLGVGVVSNFGLNHPVYNMLGLAFRGRDAVTGELIMDENVDIGTRVKEVVKAIAFNIVPPFLPGGQDFFNWRDAMAGETRPLTGRPHRHQQPFTALARMFTGLGVKGRLADQIGNWLGIGRGRDQIQAGDKEILLNLIHRAGELPFEDRWPKAEVAKLDPLNIVRSLYYRAVDESLTAEERAKAMSDLTTELNREVEFRMGPIRGTAARTERQKRLELQTIEDEGILPRFAAQSVRAQALVLVTADIAGVSDAWLRDLIEAAQFTPLRHLQIENDPGVVQQAIDHLRLHVGKPGANDRLRGFLQYLESWALPQAQWKEMLAPSQRLWQVTREKAYKVTR